MILAQKYKGGHCLFISVEPNNYNTNMGFTYPLTFKYKAHNIMVTVRTYLHKYYDYKVLQLFYDYHEETSREQYGNPSLESQYWPLTAMLTQLRKLPG